MMTFSTESSLERRTGSYGVGRFRYLQRLVTEFQDTCNQGYKKQILANLANFAYDPINYEYFRKLNVLDLFLDILVEGRDDTLIEFAVGGICNCCLDKLNREFLTEGDAIPIVIQHLSSPIEETVLSVITTLMYLTTQETKKDATSQSVVDVVKKLSLSPSRRLSNLATVFLEDYCDAN